MNARDMKPIFRALSPHFPGFVGHKRMLLKTPMNGTLRAIYFDASAYDKPSFYPATLIMPLCIPQEHLSLLLGQRLKHPTKNHCWDANLPNLIPELVTAITNQGMPILSQVDTADGYIALAEGGRGNPHVEKSIAFVLARAGERERAVALINIYTAKLDLSCSWEKHIFDISVRLRDLLIHDPEAANRQLQDWEDYTIRNLRLEAFR